MNKEEHKNINVFKEIKEDFEEYPYSFSGTREIWLDENGEITHIRGTYKMTKIQKNTAICMLDGLNQTKD